MDQTITVSLVFARSGQQLNVQIPRHIAQGILFDSGNGDSDSHENRAGCSHDMQH